MSDNPIPGNPASVDALASLLTRLGADLETVGNALKQVDTETWTGTAAEGFRWNYLDDAPSDWLTAGNAMSDVGNALRVYSGTLADQQHKAASAQADLEAAQKAAHAAPPGTPNPAVDQAQAAISQAQTAVQQAGNEAAKTVQDATSQAPQGTIPWGANMTDSLEGLGKGFLHGLGDFATGAAKTISEAINPVTMAAASANAVTHAASLVGGLVTSPGKTIGGIIDLPTWENDPSRAFGRFFPTVLAGAVGGGAAGIGAKGARVAEEGGSAGSIRELAPAENHEIPRGQVKAPDPYYHEGDPPPTGEVQQPTASDGVPPHTARPEVQPSPVGSGSWDPPPHVQAHDIQRAMDRVDTQIDSIQQNLDMRRNFGANHMDPGQVDSWRQENMQMNQQIQDLEARKATLNKELNQLRGSS